MAIKEEVIIKIYADTNQYEREVKGATRATDDLGDAIEEVEGKATLGTEAVGDLGIAAKQTGEAALDSATGVSGLGAAMSAIAGRVRTAITALSGFSKALIATGVGAAVVALGVILAYWEDISEFIQKSVLGMEDLTQGTNEYLKQAEKANRVFERQLSISEALGESEDELLRKRRLNNLAQQDQLEYALEIAKANEEKLINNGAETEELQAQFILIEDISEKLAVLETQEELLLITVNQRTAARQAEVQAIIDAQNAARQAAIEAAEFEPEGTSDAENKFKMELEAAEKFLADEEKKYLDAKKEIEESIKEMEGSIKTFETQRSQIVPGVDKLTLSKYEKILINKNGLAIVPVQGRSCGGCFMNVPAQVVNEIKMNDRIIYCEMCSRILYLTDDNA